jgi:translation elongation factor EF-G
MLNYSTELRSITAGEGDYAYQLDHYDVVPSHIASELVAKHKRELEAAHT